MNVNSNGKVGEYFPFVQFYADVTMYKNDCTERAIRLILNEECLDLFIRDKHS